MRAPAPQRQAVFFDRDGVVNRSPGPGYVLGVDQFFLNEGIAEAVRYLNERDILAIVITSQKGVGKGLMSDEDLATIHRHMQDELAKSGAAFDAIFVYTGRPDCAHRPKPDPEMILTAAERYQIDRRLSWMIGDADRDIEMGNAAGLLGTIRVRGDKSIGVPADYTLDTVLETVDLFKRIL
ncbi:MAG: HAD-IIIA family hydrolase [Verrucomicrobiales bacterium]|jgi:D-glycero-D-manno-heptose 1,7-bisphosphate phosphatase|nr:HAD-IIIA family hydrolase [Verrucomicrobiales bacterium]MDP4790357.1 HAD-IIIA family hydrolase [Verrucomicrobiales bacterium]MDP5005035.1 HAD-IIIA family hydrolase [Verrucomicrobiales bacterium]